MWWSVLIWHPFCPLGYFRRMMTLRKETFQSIRGLLLPLTFPRWTPQSQRSCWRCRKRAALWWSLQQCLENPLRRRLRRSQACGRAAYSTPTLMFRGRFSLKFHFLTNKIRFSFTWPKVNVYWFFCHWDQLESLFYAGNCGTSLLLSFPKQKVKCFLW